jgi:hypothetical protein
LIVVCVYAHFPRDAAVAVIIFVIADVAATAVAGVATASWNALLAVGDGGRQRDTEGGNLRERWTKAADGGCNGNQGPWICG